MRFIIKVLATIAFFSTLCGCAITPPSHARIPFPVEEYKQFKPTGDSTVRGTAYIEKYRAVSKNPVHHIFLLPDTSYSAQAYEIAFLACYNLALPDQRQEQYVRRLEPIANGTFQADFEFTNVPAGRYYVVDRVVYESEGTPDGGHRVRLTKVTVVEHQNLRGVEVRPPADDRQGGQSCRSFK